MSATKPFSGRPTRSDYLLVCQLADRQVWSDWQGVQDYLLALGTYSWAGIPRSNPVPSVVLANASDMTLVSVTGTTTSYGWLVNFIAFPQVQAYEWPGMVAPGLQVIARPVWGAIKQQVVLWGSPVVFVGHSQGAAVATLLASYALAEGVPFQGLYVAGGPGFVDPVWANAFPAPAWRLEDTDDPVVAIPPETQTPPPKLPFPWNLVDPLLTAARVGESITLDQYGQTVLGSYYMSYIAALTQLAGGSAPTHLASEYVRRLKAGGGRPEDMVQGAWGYPAPWILYDRLPPPSSNESTAASAVYLAEASWLAAAERCRQVCP